VAIRQHEKSDKFPLEDVAVSIQRKVRRMRILSRVNIWTVVGVIFANSNGRAMLQAPLPNSVKVPYLHADGVCVDLLQSNVSIILVCIHCEYSCQYVPFWLLQIQGTIMLAC
jgi:hypothetical protein